MNVKQVLVVRKDLKMRVGKAISQGCHGSLAIFFNRMTVKKNGNWLTRLLFWRKPTYTCSFQITEVEHAWVKGPFTKIAVSVDSEAELLEAYEKAKAMGLPVCLITDSGKTEFHGVPTNTVVGIGPGLASDIDKVTGKLKLL